MEQIKVKCLLCFWNGDVKKLVISDSEEQNFLSEFLPKEADIYSCPVCGSKDIEKYNFDPYSHIDEEEEEEDTFQ